MRVSLKPKSQTVKGVFPRGEWEVAHIGLLGITVAFCREGVDEIEVDLRPYPFDETPLDRGMLNWVKLQKKQFVYCITGWRGDLYDEDGEPLPCNDKTKEALFNYDRDFRGFVLGCLDDMVEHRGAVLKN